METKQRVNHPKFGSGVVVSNKQNGQLVQVDYKGVSKWHAKSELQPKNSYVEKLKRQDVIGLIDKHIEKAEAEYSTEARQIAITALNELKQEV